jgi:Fe-S-cluster containining protein
VGVFFRHSQREVGIVKVLQRWLRKGTVGRKERISGCLCCGKCCELFGGHLNASKADIERWRNLGREDLLNRVNRCGWIWVDPDTKRLEETCPFLRRTEPETAHCAIHDVKPDICRAYPTLAHGRRCLRGVFLKYTILMGALLAESLLLSPIRYVLFEIA